MYEIIEEKRVFDNFYKVDEALVRHTADDGSVTQFNRMKLNRKEASAVFIYNRDTDMVVFVKQFRYAITNHEKEPILEIPAGTLDDGETPLEAAKREVLEECGYRINDKNIYPTISFYASPGYSSEILHLFSATVANNDKIHEGGGIASENENVEVVEMKYSDFLDLLDNNKITDGKTLIASQYASRNTSSPDRINQ